MSLENPSSNSQEVCPSDQVPRTSDRPEPWIRRQGSRVALLILILGLIIYEAPREISRWYLAAALVAVEENESAAAGRYFDTAIEWNEDVVVAYVRQTNLGKNQSNVVPSLTNAIRLVVSLREINTWSSSPDVKHALALALNNCAYIRAFVIQQEAIVSNEMDVAQDEIEEAFELLELVESDALPDGFPEVFLDTRGYIAYLKGDYEAACSDLEAAVTEAEKSQQMPKQILAVVYHHRGEVYKALGRSVEAARDFKHASDLGYAPDHAIR